MGKAPKRTKTHLLSIDIGSHSIKMAVGQSTGDKLKLTAVGKEVLPENVYENGAILDPLTLKTIIQKMLKDYHIKQKDTVLTFESSDIIKRDLVVNRVDPADQLELITFEVGQYLPIDVDAYVIQYKVIESFEDEGVQKLKVLLGAMPKDVVKNLYELLLDAGLNPLYMDTHSNALEKFIEINFESVRLNKTLAFIDFGNEVMDISIFEKGIFRFNRLIHMGARDFDKILMSHLNIQKEEAESRKKKTSVTAIQKAGTQKTSYEEEVVETVLKETSQFFEDCTDEIDKVFKYHTSRSADNKIDQIYLYGGGAQFKEIAQYFKERFDIPTEVLNTVQGVDLALKGPMEEVPVFVHTIGALIRK